MAMAQADDTAAPRWPKQAPAQFVALRAALSGAAASPAELARHFQGARRDKLGEMVETLVALGQARATGDGRFVA
jgi:hypothetical protein